MRKAIVPGRRYNNAGDIEKLFIDGKKFCKWCAKVEIQDHYRRHYCSDLCRHSCSVFLHPQGDAALYHLLARQDFKCAGCEIDYIFFILEIINRLPLVPGDPANAHHVGYRLRAQFAPREEYALEIDHIIPIWQGGVSFGLENVQALCSNCHLQKTRKEAMKSSEVFIPPLSFTPVLKEGYGQDQSDKEDGLEESEENFFNEQ